MQLIRPGRIGGPCSRGNKISTDFQDYWDPFWREPIQAGATYTPFQVAMDTQPGFHVDDSWAYLTDVNYRVLTNNSDPVRTIYTPGSWGNRASGTVPNGTTHLPDDFVLPDADEENTPNNPLIILNTDTGTAVYLNGSARPTAGGPIYGYQASILGVPKNSTHGGSYIAGGELTYGMLNSGNINHAIAGNVWGRKYLSPTGGGFVPPAARADTGYDDPESGNRYEGNIENLKMGSRLAIPPGVSAVSLGVTSAHGLALFAALKKYGFYIVDNSAWNVLYTNGTPDVVTPLANIKSELAVMYATLQRVA